LLGQKYERTAQACLSPVFAGKCLLAQFERLLDNFVDIERGINVRPGAKKPVRTRPFLSAYRFQRARSVSPQPLEFRVDPLQDAAQCSGGAQDAKRARRVAPARYSPGRFEESGQRSLRKVRRLIW